MFQTQKTYSTSRFSRDAPHHLLWTHELGSCHPDGTLANLTSMEVLESPNSHDLMLKWFPPIKQPKGS